MWRGRDVTLWRHCFRCSRIWMSWRWTWRRMTARVASLKWSLENSSSRSTTTSRRERSEFKLAHNIYPSHPCKRPMKKPSICTKYLMVFTVGAYKRGYGTAILPNVMHYTFLWCYLIGPPLIVSVVSGSDPGRRPSRHGHVWNVWSVREGVFDAGQEEKARDEGPPQNSQPRLQRDFPLQGSYAAMTSCVQKCCIRDDVNVFVLVLFTCERTLFLFC